MRDTEGGLLLTRAGAWAALWSHEAAVYPSSRLCPLVEAASRTIGQCPVSPVAVVGGPWGQSGEEGGRRGLGGNREARVQAPRAPGSVIRR